MPRSSLTLAAVAVLALAGCTTQGGTKDSAGKFTGEQRLVAQTVDDFQSAASKGDQAQICSDLLAKPLVSQIAKQGGTCEKAVDSTLKDTDSFGLTVESVSITGNQAVAHVKADHGKKDVARTLTLVKEGAAWRISQFGSG